MTSTDVEPRVPLEPVMSLTETSGFLRGLRSPANLFLFESKKNISFATSLQILYQMSDKQFVQKKFKI